MEEHKPTFTCPMCFAVHDVIVAVAASSVDEDVHIALCTECGAPMLHRYAKGCAILDCDRVATYAYRTKTGMAYVCGPHFEMITGKSPEKIILDINERIAERNRKNRIEDCANEQAH